MNIGEWSIQAEHILRHARITTARLDALVVLADECGHDKSWVLAHPEYDLQIEQLEKLNTKITQRASHVPLAYIRGKSEFYGRTFLVDQSVLIPRPESEAMIELLKEAVNSAPLMVIYDIGTGSGCLAITAKLEIAEATVIATDIDDSCLALAKKNAELLGADVAFLQGDLLQPIRKNEKRKTIILANLPYVPDEYPINEAAEHEPKLALYGGYDGLDYYRELFAQTGDLHHPPAYVITESLFDQHETLRLVAERHGYILKRSIDLAQRFVIGTT